MAKRLEREFGRYDVDALDSDEYLGMPRAVRNDAYLYLLVLSGRSRKRLSDGVLTRVMADDLARRMGCTGAKLLAALHGVGMVTFDELEVTILKFAKWQQTRAEIEEVRAERAAAGRAGGIVSGEVRRSKAEAIASPNRSKAEANGEAFGLTLSKQNEAEIEIEKREKIVSNETIVSLVPFDPRAERLVQLLSGILEERGVKFKAGKDWTVEADRLVRLDKRDFTEASALLTWATSHHFWASNILSMPKFREKYDQLRLQRERELTQPSRPNAVEESIARLLGTAKA